MGDFSDDLTARLGYRIAYGEAARLVEISRFDHGWGCDFATRLSSRPDAIVREVRRRVSPSIADELIRLAVEDVVSERKPRW